MAEYIMDELRLTGMPGENPGDVWKMPRTKVDSTLTQSGQAADAEKTGEEIDALKEDLSQKANADGSYDTLTAGNAKQLLSNLEQTDTVPYNYRTAGGSLEIGDREKLKKIVGGSLAVNQLVNWQNGNKTDQTVTFTASNGVVTAVVESPPSSMPFWGVSSNPKFINDHVYFMCGCPTGGGWGSTGNYRYVLDTGSGIGQDKGSGLLKKYTGTTGNYYIRVYFGVDAVAGTYTFKPQLFDLTAMLGTTIADYVYSLETATAGAGVAWLKVHFPRIFDAGYIPYNAGTLEHVSGLSAHKMVGFNQWDEEWESGTYSTSDGTPTSATNSIRGKNPIKCVSNTVYYFRTTPGITGGNVYYYDADDNFISVNTAFGNHAFTTPTNCDHIRISMGTSYGTTYNHDICINLHWDGERDGEYEAYEEHSYPLDSDVTLRGIYKLDANNQLYADGDEYEADGTVNRRFNTITFDGSDDEGWQLYSGVRFMCGNTVMDFTSPASSVVANINTNQGFVVVNKSGLPNTTNGNKYISAYDEGGHRFLANFSLNTLEEVKAYLAAHPLTVIYEKNAVTTESADPYTEIQNVSNWGTEEFVSESLVPVGHETAYQPDLRAKIEVAPESPDTDGVYIMQRDNGLNSYVALASSATIQDIISRLEALEGSGT